MSSVVNAFSDGLLVAYGYDPSMAISVGQDSDGDGVSDLDELRNGTNPHDAADQTTLLFGARPITEVTERRALTDPADQELEVANHAVRIKWTPGMRVYLSGDTNVAPWVADSTVIFNPHCPGAYNGCFADPGKRLGQPATNAYNTVPPVDLTSYVTGLVVDAQGYVTLTGKLMSRMLPPQPPTTPPGGGGGGGGGGGNGGGGGGGGGSGSGGWPGVSPYAWSPMGMVNYGVTPPLSAINTPPPSVVLDPQHPQVPPSKLTRANTPLWLVTTTPPQIEIAVDGNRDGVIKFASQDSTDLTSTNRPFVFWVNDDHDQPHPVDGNDREEDDLEIGGPDYKDKVITCRRDLEDFQRIWIKTNENLLSSDDVVLRWEPDAGSPSINIYRAAEADGGTAYLTSETVNQVWPSPNGTALGTASAGVDFVFPRLNDFQKNATSHFLFEGAGAGKGWLKVYIKRGSQMIEGEKIYVELKDIKQMYEQWTVGDGNVEPSQTANRSGFNYSVPVADEEKDYVLLVHGWNVFGWEKERNAETMYKRLYWQGHKGRVGVFRWPCLTDATVGLPTNGENGMFGSSFDPSEFKAWKSGTGLLNCLTQLNGLGYNGRVRVLAHSQGNVVMTEALRQAKEGNLGQVCHTYVATQAALSAHCYDASPSLPLMPSGVNYPTTPNVYADYWAGGHVPYADPNHIGGSAGHFVNFYNPDDFGLNEVHWQLAQKTKPDSCYNYLDTLGFYYDPWLPWNARSLALPQDRFEIFAFCAESRSYALGAQPGVAGVFDATKSTNLKSTTYGFTQEHKFHSGQFRSTIAKRWGYWDRFLVVTGLKAPQ